MQQNFIVWKKAISDKDKDLIPYVLGGYYIQLRKKENHFTTKEVFSLLYENGILLADAKRCEYHHIKARNVIKVGTVKQQNKFRISENAQKLIHEILDSATQ